MEWIEIALMKIRTFELVQSETPTMTMIQLKFNTSQIKER